MKLNKSYLIFIFIIIFFSFQVYALSDVLGEGETKNYNLGGVDYGLTVMIIEDVSPATVTFEINGIITPQLQDGDEHPISQTTSIFIDDIVLNEAGEAGSGDIVKITFGYCGDNICSDEEHCGICNSDCGCEGGYYCDFDECSIVECGDNICSDWETCEKDDCCYGDEKDTNSDTYNCGTCGNSCGFKEKCIEGVCQGYCGNNICEENEKDFCFDDCVVEIIEEEPEETVEEEPVNIIQEEPMVKQVIELEEIIEEKTIELEPIEEIKESWIKKIIRWFWLN